MLGLSLLLSLSLPATPPDQWGTLREQLDSWVLTDNFAVTIGDASGPLFQYTHGNFTLDTLIGTASTSKWPLAMMFVGLVADGTIRSLDAKASEYVRWWATEVGDPKSQVTLRHLLSFTSGFGTGAPGQENASDLCMDSSTSGLDYDGCAQQVYLATNLSGTPGKTYTYNSVHLQLAGAVAMSASGLGIQEIIAKYLLEPYGMVNSSCANPTLANPQLAVCLKTTALDYQQFLFRTLTYSVLPKKLVDVSEIDYTPFMSDSYTLYGNYGFGHFLECFDSVDGFTPACREASIHIDPGAFGFYPLIDRSRNYYMQIVAYENGRVAYPRSGIPEYLRFLVKPLADAVIAGEPGLDAFGHHTPRLNGVTLADVNYMAGCYIHPERC